MVEGPFYTFTMQQDGIKYFDLGADYTVEGEPQQLLCDATVNTEDPDSVLTFLRKQLAHFLARRCFNTANMIEAKIQHVLLQISIGQLHYLMACESRKVREQRTEIDGLKKELALEQSKRRIAEADAAEMPAKRFRSLLGGAASASQLDLTQDLDTRHNASPKMLRVH